METNNEAKGVVDLITEEPSAEEENDRMQAEETAAEQVQKEPAAQPAFCTRCGAELTAGQLFCPKCGQKAGEAKAEPDTGAAAKNSKKRIGIIAGAVAAIAAIVIIILAIRGVQAKSVTLNRKEISVKVGETASLTYTINPTDTKDQSVTWTSSNDAIARAAGGTITGVNEGECEITVSTKNKKTDTCTVTVLPAGPDLREVYREFCDSSFATLASDGSYLSIDTNPDDKDDYIDYVAYFAITSVNEALGLPESVLNKMNQTRAVDGMQSYSTDDLDITWTYHPDDGLEVTYALR